MKKMYTNNTDKIVYPGGLAIRPGDSRLVDECYFPKAQGDSQPELFNASEFIKPAVGEIVVLLATLPTEQLVEVVLAEESKNRPRKTLLDAIADELEEREALAAKEIVEAELNEKDTEELQLMLLDEDNSDEDNALIHSVLDGRLSAVANESEQDEQAD
jgi:hypothetical protein